MVEMRLVLFFGVCLTPGIFSAPAENPTPTTLAPSADSSAQATTAPPPPAPSTDDQDGNQNKPTATHVEFISGQPLNINDTLPPSVPTGQDGDRALKLPQLAKPKIPALPGKSDALRLASKVPVVGGFVPNSKNETKVVDKPVCDTPDCKIKSDHPDVGVAVFGDKYKTAEKGNPYSTNSGQTTSAKDRANLTAGQNFATGFRDGLQSVFGKSEGTGDVITQLAGKGKGRVSKDKTYLDPLIDGAVHGAGTVGGTAVDLVADNTGTQFLLKDAAYYGAFSAAQATGQGKAAEYLLPAKAAYDGVKTVAVLTGTEQFIGMKGREGRTIVRVEEGGEGRLKRRKNDVKAPPNGTRLSPEDYYYYAYDDGKFLDLEGLPLASMVGGGVGGVPGMPG